MDNANLFYGVGKIFFVKVLFYSFYLDRLLVNQKQNNQINADYATTKQDSMGSTITTDTQGWQDQE